MQDCLSGLYKQADPFLGNNRRHSLVSHENYVRIATFSLCFINRWTKDTAACFPLCSFMFPWVTDDIRSAARRRSGRLAAQAAAAVGVKCRHEQSQAGSQNTRNTTTQPDKLTPAVRVRGTGVRSDTAVKIAMERTRDFFGQVQSAYRRWQGKEGRGKHKISWAGEVHFLRIFLPGIFHIERNKKDGWDIILSSNTEMLNTYVASKGRSVANKLIWTEPKRHTCIKSVVRFYGKLGCGNSSVWVLGAHTDFSFFLRGK